MNMLWAERYGDRRLTTLPHVDNADSGADTDNYLSLGLAWALQRGVIHYVEQMKGKPMTPSVRAVVIPSAANAPVHPCHSCVRVGGLRESHLISWQAPHRPAPSDDKRRCRRRLHYLDAKCTPDDVSRVLGAIFAESYTFMPGECERCELRLTPRERAVILLLGGGISPVQVADRLCISHKTVSSHKRAAMRKLRLRRTTELYHWVKQELDYEKGAFCEQD